MQNRIDIDAVRARLAEGASVKDIAHEMGISREGIYCALRRKKGKSSAEEMVDAIMPAVRRTMVKEVARVMGGAS